jgi:hypothetical protein
MPATLFLDYIVGSLLKYQLPSASQLAKLATYGEIADMFTLTMKPEFINYLLNTFKSNNKTPKLLSLRLLSDKEVLGLPMRARGASEYFRLDNYLTGKYMIIMITPSADPVNFLEKSFTKKNEVSFN